MIDEEKLKEAVNQEFEETRRNMIKAGASVSVLMASYRKIIRLIEEQERME